MSTEVLLPEDGSDAKQRLLMAAEEIFADYGYEGASVRQICNKAGVNIAGVNYYFGDKENLYVEAVKRAHMCNARDMPVENLAPPGTPPVVRLELFIRGMVASMHTPARPSAMKLMMREMAHPGKAAGTVVDEFIRPLAFHLRGILHELLPHLDEHRLLMTGFSVIAQCLYYRQNRPLSELIFGKAEMEALTVDMVADHVVRFTLTALNLGPNKRYADDADGSADQRG
jgi:TetR/AcrR family transcriptional regulator, regulator of cefoperazone and chloramphenicol sensitivity